MYENICATLASFQHEILIQVGFIILTSYILDKSLDEEWFYFFKCEFLFCLSIEIGINAALRPSEKTGIGCNVQLGGYSGT